RRRTLRDARDRPYQAPRRLPDHRGVAAGARRPEHVRAREDQPADRHAHHAEPADRRRAPDDLRRHRAESLPSDAARDRRPRPRMDREARRQEDRVRRDPEEQQTEVAALLKSVQSYALSEPPGFFEGLHATNAEFNASSAEVTALFDE